MTDATVPMTRLALRRMFYPALYAAYVLIAAAVVTAGPDAGRIEALGVLGLLCAAFALTGIAMRTSRHWAWQMRGDCLLDERERELRTRAYRGAYLAAGGTVLVALIYLSIAVDAGLRMPATYLEISAVLGLALLVHMTLPAAVLSWLDDGDGGEVGLGPTPPAVLRGVWIKLVAIGLAGVVVGATIAWLVN